MHNCLTTTMIFAENISIQLAFSNLWGFFVFNHMKYVSYEKMNQPCLIGSITGLSLKTHKISQFHWFWFHWHFCKQMVSWSLPPITTHDDVNMICELRYMTSVSHGIFNNVMTKIFSFVLSLALYFFHCPHPR